MATPSVSRPENCAALTATPTRKAPSKAPRSVRGVGAPEAAQLERRPRGPAYGVADVELDHLVSGPLPGVGYLDRNARPIPEPDPGWRQAQVRVRERGVRRAVAEGEQRLRGVEQVSPPGRWLAVVAHGKVPHMAGDGDGELAAGIDVAEQGLRHGRAGFLAEVPSIQNRGHAVY